MHLELCGLKPPSLSGSCFWKISWFSSCPPHLTLSLLLMYILTPSWQNQHWFQGKCQRKGQRPCFMHCSYWWIFLNVNMGHTFLRPKVILPQVSKELSLQHHQITPELLNSMPIKPNPQAFKKYIVCIQSSSSHSIVWSLLCLSLQLYTWDLQYMRLTVLVTRRD